MQLYSFFRSSASYRVRIALACKALSCDDVDACRPLDVIAIVQATACPDAA
jgi:hypothetical protein